MASEIVSCMANVELELITKYSVSCVASKRIIQDFIGVRISTEVYFYGIELVIVSATRK